MLIDAPSYIACLSPEGLWARLDSLCRVERERRNGDKVERNTACCISSLTGSAEQLAHAIRSHWELENALHWRLDIAFREDQSRVRVRYAAENFVVLPYIALNLLKSDKSRKPASSPGVCLPAGTSATSCTLSRPTLKFRCVCPISYFPSAR